jgi:hypothetical protein
MVNSVSSSAAVTQWHLQVHEQAKPPAKPKATYKEDTVVLSHQATQAVDADSDHR